MLGRRVWLLRCLIFLIVWSMGCWLGRSEAYEPWKGKVTARVNVRKAPGETSNVITQIDKGVQVTISDEREGWYKVVVEEDTFGFIGWIYGKYVKDPTALSATASPSPQPQEKSGVLSSKPTTSAASHAAPADGVPKAPPGRGARSEGELGKSGPADDKVSSGVRQKEITTEPVVERAGNVSGNAPREKSVEKRKADPPEIGKALVEERAHSDEAALQKTSQEVEQGNVSSPVPSSSAASMSPETHLESETSAPVKKLNAPSVNSDPVVGIPGTKTTGADDSKQGQVWRAVTGVVVKLVVVAFSCLALLFAYRAWQITNGRNEG